MRTASGTKNTEWTVFSKQLYRFPITLNSVTVALVKFLQKLIQRFVHFWYFIHICVC